MTLRPNRFPSLLIPVLPCPSTSTLITAGSFPMICHTPLFLLALILCMRLTLVVLANSVDQGFYANCNSRTISCIGFGDGSCIEYGSCEYVLGFAVLGKEKRILVEMFSEVRKGNKRYMAVGFSEGPKMGNDAVVACITYRNDRGVFLSYNTKTKNVPASSSDSSAVEMMDIKYENDQIYCKFTLPFVFTVHGAKYNIKDNQYTLLFAHGPAPTQRTLGYHGRNGHGVTGERIRLGSSANTSRTYSPSKIFIKDWVLVCHTVLLVYSYICFIPTGMLVARYLKESSRNSHLCGNSIWFPIHSSVQLTSVVLIITAQMAVIVDLGFRKASVGITAHSAIGVVSTVILIINAAIGAFRGLVAPSLSHKGKVVFGILHWIGAILGYSLGLLQIFITPYFIPNDIPSCTFPSVLTAVSLGLFLVAYLSLAVLQFYQDYNDEKKMSENMTEKQDVQATGENEEETDLHENPTQPVAFRPKRRSGSSGAMHVQEPLKKSILKRRPESANKQNELSQSSQPKINESEEASRESRFAGIFGVLKKNRVAEEITPSNTSSVGPKVRSRKITWRKKVSYNKARASHMSRVSQMTVDTLQTSGTELENDMFLLEPFQYDYFRLIFALDDEDTDDECEWSKWRSFTQYPLKTLSSRGNNLTLVFEIIITFFLVCSGCIAGYLSYLLLPNPEFRANCRLENEIDDRGKWFFSN